MDGEVLYDFLCKCGGKCACYMVRCHGLVYVVNIRKMERPLQSKLVLISRNPKGGSRHKRCRISKTTVVKGESRNQDLSAKEV
ncbi:hypothetical protein BHM03_00054887 [Ensete ventricosum]|nr:hypothetical protein BHM03_00054887 [Ensete ventricosum]